MRVWCALLVLLLACLTAASHFGPYVVTHQNHIAPNAHRVPILSRAVVANKVDIAIRDKYWYYLPRARLVYLAHINSPEGCLFLHMYKNRVGTFLVITNWLDDGQVINVNTFVRLGDGTEDEAHIDAAIRAHPFVVSLDLGYGQYLVPHDPYADPTHYNYTESWASQHWFTSSWQEREAERRCKSVEDYIREQYKHYLPNASTLSVSRSNAKEQCYCVFHFVNRVGLWEAIGRWDYPHDCPRVNTFVRVGDGYDPEHVENIHVFPSVTTPWHY